MSDDHRSLMHGLTRVAARQLGVALFMAIVGTAFVAPLAKPILASIAAVTIAMLIGFMPLRLLLRLGPDRIVAGWVAAMIVRMIATLVGLVLLVKRYDLPAAIIVWMVCGTYLLLLAVETAGVVGLMRREFERRATSNGDTGDR